MKSVLNAVRTVARSRFGQILCIVHLGIIMLFFGTREPVPRHSNNDVHSRYSSTILIAGRGFHYHYEPTEVKILILLDAPGLLFSFVLALLLVPVGFILPPIGDYDASWVVAGIFLVGTSTQWYLVGYFLERFFRRHSQRSAPSRP